MDKEKFERYLLDESVIKHGRLCYESLHCKGRDVVTYFSFSHIGLDMSNPGEKRINFKIYPFHQYQGPSPREIIDEVLVLVNSDSPDYAVLFKITVDVDKRIAKVEMIESPELDMIVSEEEKDGIVISF